MEPHILVLHVFTANMDAFWHKLSTDLEKKSSFHCGLHDCTEWVGAREHNLYGKKSVSWPDGTKTMERTHRLSYMLSKKLLRDQMPTISAAGEQLDVSHLCHNPLCIKAEHLILEPHSVNMERMGCKIRQQCTRAHFPLCIL